MKKRTFIAIKTRINPLVLNQVNKIQSALSQDKIKWVKHDQFHITLAFLGDTPTKYLSKITENLEITLQNYHPFAIELSGIGAFPNPHTPKTLWIGIEPNLHLINIKKSIDKALESYSFYKPIDKLHPHITIGRYKSKTNTNFSSLFQAYKNKYLQEMLVSSIIFYESELSAEGPNYSPLHFFNLNGEMNND